VRGLHFNDNISALISDYMHLRVNFQRQTNSMKDVGLAKATLRHTLSGQLDRTKLGASSQSYLRGPVEGSRNSQTEPNLKSTYLLNRC
jgi:hypothetical protein